MIYSRTIINCALCISLLGLAACNMSSDTTKASAMLAASSEVPPNNSTAKGEADIKINVKSNQLSWEITHSDLSGAVTKAHFHGPADMGVNASVAVPITGDMLSPIKGEATISNEQETQLLEGKWYLNLHTAAYPEGEIRGQVLVESRVQP